MHVLYVHQNFPAQFGHIAQHLVEKLGWKCTFVSETPGGNVGGIEKIQYKLDRRGDQAATTSARARSRTPSGTATASTTRSSRRPDVKPDLIVGHSGFGSTLFLRELYPGRADHQFLRVLLPPARPRQRHGLPQRPGLGTCRR